MSQKATMTKYELLESLNMSQSWGKICNQIQDAAEKALTTLQWNAYLHKANKDMGECDGSDFLVLNGQYFDWKEFESKKTEIVLAFLDYFTDVQIYRISKCL